MMRFVGVASAGCLALLIVACDSGAKDLTHEKQLASLSLISEENLQAHVRYLADDTLGGREAGEAGYDISAEYVVEQFAAMGLTAAGSDAWYQPVSLRGYKTKEGSAELLVHRSVGDEAFAYREDFSIVPDAVRNSSSVRAEVVYVGYGVHAPEFGYSDYDGIDVAGKIVAVFSGAPDTIEGSEGSYYSSSRTKSLEAVARGAVGSLSLRSQKSEERRPWEDLKARIGKHERKTWINAAGQAAGYYPELRGGASLTIEAAERVFALSPLSFYEAQQGAVQSTPSSVALGVEVTLAAHSEHSTIKSSNIVGMVRGTDSELADEFVVYTAHLDHVGIRDADDENEVDRIHNGMYDNAMGVALMLETARAIAAAPLKRSVLFIALTAEESGLLGSDYFVNNPTVAIESVVANINLDMPLFLYPVADLVAFGSQHSSLQAIVKASSNAEGFTFSPDPVPEERLFVRSDQYSFVRAGIPSVYLVTGFNSTDEDVDGETIYRDHIENHYHKPSDDLMRPVDWDSAVRFARAHTRMGQAVANERERPTWNEGDFFAERFTRF